MSEKQIYKPIRLFNTPIEIGLRSLIILSVNSGVLIDIERLMYLDFLSLNTSDIGGPESLHAPIPNRGVQIYSKKELINKGLVILLSKELVKLVPNKTGFVYEISEAGNKFLSFFQTKYYNDLVERAKWVSEKFTNTSTDEIKQYIDANIQMWGSEFVTNNQVSNL